MKYQHPVVEEDPEIDANKPPKRKRDTEQSTTTTTTQEEELQPPSKTAKPIDSLFDDELGLGGGNLEEDEYDEGDVDEDLSQEGDDEGNFGEERYEEAGQEEDAEADIEEEEEEEEEGEKEEKEGEEYGEEYGEGEEVGEEQEDEVQQVQGSRGEQKLHKTIEKFGRAPLEGTSLAEQALTSSPETIFAMLIDAMLKSRPISHDLSQRAVNKVIDVGFHDIRKLGDSSWEERTQILKDGGYNRYREQGATNLGDLVEFVDEKYNGDLNNLLKEADYDRQKTRDLVKEVKGLGDVGADLFFNNVQSVWPSIAPFVDSRSLETAKEVGIGTDLDAIYEDLEQDSVRMCKLANALSAARLERRIGDLLAI